MEKGELFIKNNRLTLEVTTFEINYDQEVATN